MKPSQVRKALHAAIRYNRAAFLWGAPGIGKSDLVRSIASDLGIALIDKRLSQSDPTELKGYPWPDSKKKIMTFFQDGSLPTEGRGILFLDELNNAPAAVQAPAYQLVLDRRLGDYVLPPGWHVIAAGNRASDRSITHTMAGALLNRFIHLDMDADLEDWIVWAKRNGIRPGTQGYLRYRPTNLCVAKIEAGMRAFPSPRTWAVADAVAYDPALAAEPDVRQAMLAGIVGEGVAIEYAGFIREEANLPKLESILLNPTGAPVPKEPSTLYAVVSRLENQATENNLETLSKYAARLPKEFEVMFFHNCSKSETLVETQVMTNWIQANHHVLI